MTAATDICSPCHPGSHQICSPQTLHQAGMGRAHSKLIRNRQPSDRRATTPTCGPQKERGQAANSNSFKCVSFRRTKLAAFVVKYVTRVVLLCEIYLDPYHHFSLPSHACYRQDRLVQILVHRRISYRTLPSLTHTLIAEG